MPAVLTVATEISSVLEVAETILDTFVTMIPKGLNLILSNAVLFIPVAIMLIGAAFGILHRVIRRG